MSGNVLVLRMVYFWFSHRGNVIAETVSNQVLTMEHAVPKFVGCCRFQHACEKNRRPFASSIQSSAGARRQLEPAMQRKGSRGMRCPRLRGNIHGSHMRGKKAHDFRFPRLAAPRARYARYCHKAWMSRSSCRKSLIYVIISHWMLSENVLLAHHLFSVKTMRATQQPRTDPLLGCEASD